MKKLTQLFISLLLTLALSIVPTAQASSPVAGCPGAQWSLMAVMEHEEHMHHHIGNDADHNGETVPRHQDGHQ